MKAAIATDNGRVSQHFGRCQEYTIAVIENGACVSQETLENPGHEPGVLPELLSSHGVDVIVAGGMGRRAQALFDQYGISQIIGVESSVTDAIACLERDELTSGDNSCSPKHEHQHEHEHVHHDH